jgi:Xaa-Pro aminopeptidase
MSERGDTAIVMAGSPATNASVYQRIRFMVVDPVAVVEFPASEERLMILRDIEGERARNHARATGVYCPADFAPEEGLSGDRATATAQATAECMKRSGVKRAIGDRSLPLIYVEMIKRAGIAVEYDSDLGVLDRRQKDEQEVEFLRQAQRITEAAIEKACRMIATATARSDGVLEREGATLTSERVRFEVDRFLLSEGYSNPTSIIACGPDAADCHNEGVGPIRTGSPVIVDIFPQNMETRYCGDCTRTVVHGDIPDEVARMREAVALAKLAGIDATRVGVTGESVHEATIRTISASGYGVGLPGEGASDDYCGMTHGTGHGIGLEVHESPLLDFGGPALLEGDALTIEPGLYSKAIGAVRLEDLVIVRENGCENLNTLPEGLDWR